MSTNTPLSWLDGLAKGYAEVADESAALPQRARVRFLGAVVTVEDNEAEESTDVTIDPSSVVVESNTWDPVAAVATVNVNLGLALASADGVSLATDDRVGLIHQDTLAENGIYVKLANGHLQRASDANASAFFLTGKTFSVVGGGTYRGRSFYLSSPTPLGLDSDDLVFLDTADGVDAKVWAKANGTTDDRANLTAATTASATVRLTPGSYLISDNGTVGASGKTLEIIRGASFTVASGKTLTVDGHFTAAPDQHIFKGLGTVVPGAHAPRTVHVGWFGAVGDGATDDAAAIQRAIDWCVTAGGGTVLFQGRRYAVGTTLAIGAEHTMARGVRLVAERPAYFIDTCTLSWIGAAGGTIIRIRSAHAGAIENLGFDGGNGLADTAIHFHAVLGGDDLLGVVSWRVIEPYFVDFNYAAVLIGPPDGESAAIGSDCRGVVISDGHFLRPSGSATPTYHVRQRNANAIGTSLFRCQFDGDQTYPTYFVGCQLGGIYAVACTSIGCGLFDIRGDFDPENSAAPGYMWVTQWESQSKQFFRLETVDGLAAPQRNWMFAGVMQGAVPGSTAPIVYSCELDAFNAYGPVDFVSCRFLKPVKVGVNTIVHSVGTNFGGGTDGEWLTHPENVSGDWVDNAGVRKMRAPGSMTVDGTLGVAGASTLTGQVNAGAAIRSTGAELRLGISGTDLLALANIASYLTIVPKVAGGVLISSIALHGAAADSDIVLDVPAAKTLYAYSDTFVFGGSSSGPTWLTGTNPSGNCLLTAGNLFTVVAPAGIKLRTGGGPQTLIELDSSNGIGVFGNAPAPQAADILALGDSISGSVARALAAIPDPANAPVDADALRDDLVTNVLPKIRDALSSLASFGNDVRGVLRLHGWMA